MMAEERFWTKSYDPGLTDIDPIHWEKSYVDAVAPIFKRFPAKPAFAFMGVEVTFAELDRYANRFAHMLLAQGLKKGDVVGINLPNIPEYIIAWLGILRAGCVVSGVSPLLSAEEMKYQLKDSNAVGLVTIDAIFAARLTGIVADLPELKVVATTSVGGFLPAIKRVLGRLLKKIPHGKVTPLPGRYVVDMIKVIRGSEFSSERPAVTVTPDDIAYIQYTGGTTGSPKGAMLTHRNAVADLIIVQTWVGWEEGKGLALSGFPFFHIAGLFFNANCIYLGWTQILIPNPRDTDHICKELAKYRPTALVNVPSLFQMLIANPRFKELDHSRLETCISAAAPFPEESQRELEKIVGRGKLLEVYGMTETSPLTTMNPSKRVRKLGSIGLPLRRRREDPEGRRHSRRDRGHMAEWQGPVREGLRQRRGGAGRPDAEHIPLEGRQHHQDLHGERHPPARRAEKAHPQRQAVEVPLVCRHSQPEPDNGADAAEPHLGAARPGKRRPGVPEGQVRRPNQDLDARGDPTVGPHAQAALGARDGVPLHEHRLLPPRFDNREHDG